MARHQQSQLGWAPDLVSAKHMAIGVRIAQFCKGVPLAYLAGSQVESGSPVLKYEFKSFKLA